MSNGLKIFLKNNLIILKTNLKFFLAIPCLLYHKQKKGFFTKPLKRLQFLVLPQSGLFLGLSRRFFRYSSNSFYEVLVLKGIGFKIMELKNSWLSLELGFSHLVKIKIPRTLHVFSDHKTMLFIGGNNLENVKNFCSKIMRQKSKDVYKGKGIFFRTEKIYTKSFKKK